MSHAGDAVIGILVALGLLATLLAWVFALVDCIRTPPDVPFRAGDKLIWVIVIVFTGCIGAVIYFAIGRPSARGR